MKFQIIIRQICQVSYVVTISVTPLPVKLMHAHINSLYKANQNVVFTLIFSGQSCLTMCFQQQSMRDEYDQKPRKLVSTFKVMQPEFHFCLVFNREFQEEEMNDVLCT
jgi:hypothetical protein